MCAWENRSETPTTLRFVSQLGLKYRQSCFHCWSGSTLRYIQGFPYYSYFTRTRTYTLYILSHRHIHLKLCPSERVTCNRTTHSTHIHIYENVSCRRTGIIQVLHICECFMCVSCIRLSGPCSVNPIHCNATLYNGLMHTHRTLDHVRIFYTKPRGEALSIIFCESCLPINKNCFHMNKTIIIVFNCKCTKFFLCVCVWLNLDITTDVELRLILYIYWTIIFAFCVMYYTYIFIVCWLKKDECRQIIPTFIPQVA